MERRVSGTLAACRLVAAAGAAVLTTACSSSGPSGPGAIPNVSRPAFSENEYGVRTSPRAGHLRKGGGHYKLGSPYKVAGRWYVPRENPNHQERGVASWYGADFHGRKTANGEVFDARALTAAHPTLPLPSYAYVTNLENGKTVLVRVNDRGPYVNNRVIDMSYAAASELGYVNKGRARVHVRYAGRAPLSGDDTREKQFLASQRGGRGFEPAPAREYASAESSRYAGLPPEASDRWSPTDYRASRAGRPAQPSLPAAMQTASYEAADTRQGRMALSAPAPQPFARSSVEDSPGAAGQMGAGQTGSGRAYVQVGIFRDLSNAERLRRELGSLGPVEVAPLQAGDGSSVYRVRVGPFSRAGASRAQGQIATYGVAGTAVVTE